MGNVIIPLEQAIREITQQAADHLRTVLTHCRLCGLPWEQCEAHCRTCRAPLVECVCGWDDEDM